MHIYPAIKLKKTSLPKRRPKHLQTHLKPKLYFKILEKIVAIRLRSHIYTTDLSNVLQSAYKQFHSTETALLKVHNDISLNIDNGKVTALTSLDLSATFEPVDQDILITRLSVWYGISGIALNSYYLYQTDRRQAINIGN